MQTPNSNTEVAPPAPIPAAEETRWGFEWMLLAIVVAIVVFARWRLLSLPMERDEGEYAYGAQILQSGAGRLYRDLHSMKWPGIYAAYALIINLLGETREGIRQGLLALNLMSAAGIYLLAREFLEKRFAAFSTAAFLVLTLLPATQGNIANAEHFALLWSIFGWWLLSISLPQRQLLGVFVSGALLGLAPVMKQHAISFVLLGGAFTLCSPWPATCKRWGQNLLIAAIYAAGILLVWGGMLAVIRQQGIWPEFYLWTIVYPRDYTSQIPLEWAWVFFQYNLTPILKVTWPLWLLAGWGTLALARRPEAEKWIWPLGLLLAGAMATVPGFYFRTHYFLFLMPGLALLAGFGLRGAEQWRSSHAPSQGTSFAGLVGLLSLGIPLGLQADLLAWKPMDQVSRSMYELNPFVEAPRIAAYLKDHMAPDERVVIFGSEPQICFEAQRRLAGGFVYMYPMMELHPLVQTMQQQMIAEVTASRPEYAVLVAIHSSWMGRKESDLTLTEWMNDYLLDEFVPCGLVRILSPTETDYQFAEDGEEIDLSQFHFEEDSKRIVIYRRRELEL